jgi:dATP pyrophosphohydrolase
MRRPFEVLVFLHRPGPRDEEFLVLHRVDGGYWHGLSGGIEDDETAFEAAVREVHEETALAVGEALRPTGLAFSYSLLEEPERLAAFPAGTADIHVTCFEARVEPGWEPTLNEEHDAHRWCPLDEAVALYRWSDAGTMLLRTGRALEAAR